MYKTFLPMTIGRLHPMPQSQAIAKTLIETRMKDRIELDFLRNKWLLLFGWSGLWSYGILLVLLSIENLSLSFIGVECLG
jgi:hypothetical protein